MPHKDHEQRKAYLRAYRKRKRSDPDFKKADNIRLAENKKIHIAMLRGIVDKWKQQGCCLCGEDEPACLDAHHVDPDEKEFVISDGVRRLCVAESRMLEELKKCICVCRNCHAKIHAGIIHPSER